MERREGDLGQPGTSGAVDVLRGDEKLWAGVRKKAMN